MNKQTRWIPIAAGAFVLVAAVLGLAVAEARGGGGFGGHFGSHGPGGPAAFNDTNGALTGRYVNFTVDASTATITNLDPTATNATHPLVSEIQLALPAGATATGATHGTSYVLSDGAGDRLTVPDTRAVGFNAMSVNGTTVTITLPAGATLVAHDAVASWSPAGATVTYANGNVANLVLSKNATLTQSGQVLTVTLPAHGGLQFGLLHAGFGGMGHAGMRGHGMRMGDGMGMRMGRGGFGRMNGSTAGPAWGGHGGSRHQHP